MRKQIVAGNWKMNKNLQQGKELCNSILNQLEATNKEVILAVPYTHLTVLAEIIKDSDLKLAAQNCHHELSGAYTGEISASMFSGLGVDYVILGHSERREYSKEDNDLLRKKVDAVLSQNLKVIYCCGETLIQRSSGFHFDLVAKQIIEVVFHLNPQEMKDIIIAYEPVWAIGTGETASIDHINEIREQVKLKLKDSDLNIPVLYGGSVNPSNSKGILESEFVDGVLVGGASTKIDQLEGILNSI